MFDLFVCTEYNITMMSRWSCARIVTERAEENIVEMLSIGSLFLLVFGSIFGCYVIIGCGYNWPLDQFIKIYFATMFTIYPKNIAECLFAFAMGYSRKFYMMSPGITYMDIGD